jgi:hypothetical protein
VSYPGAVLDLCIATAPPPAIRLTSGVFVGEEGSGRPEGFAGLPSTVAWVNADTAPATVPRLTIDAPSIELDAAGEGEDVLANALDDPPDTPTNCAPGKLRFQSGTNFCPEVDAGLSSVVLSVPLATSRASRLLDPDSESEGGGENEDCSACMVLPGLGGALEGLVLLARRAGFVPALKSTENDFWAREERMPVGDDMPPDPAGIGSGRLPIPDGESTGGEGDRDIDEGSWCVDTPVV